MLAISAVREELAYSKVVRPKLALMDNGIVTEVQATKGKHLAMVLHRLHAQAPDGIIFLSVEAEDPPWVFLSSLCWACSSSLALSLANVIPQ